MPVDDAGESSAERGYGLACEGLVKSYLTHLQCTETGKTYDADEVHTVSPDAQKVLYPRYDLPGVAREREPAWNATCSCRSTCRTPTRRRLSLRVERLTGFA